MLTGLLRACLLVAVSIPTFAATFAQSARSQSKRAEHKVPSQSQKSEATQKPEPTAEPAPAPSPPEEGQEGETIKIDTNLVLVPVIATDTSGLYVSDLKKEEFNVLEDDVKQDVAFFATVSAPFHVVLMLDTSASTREKLSLIQRAASTFVEQLQPADQVKVISFDDTVSDHNEFTNDRAALKAAINRTRPGQGTKLYDAVELALTSIRRIEGRKAIVLFTDGMDFHSDQASFDGTLRGLDEEGVIVYPIRYDTREETERLAREQAEAQVPQLPTIDVVRRPPAGTTAPTFPSDDPESVPTSGTTRRTGPLGLPLPSEILRRRRESERGQDRYPPDDRQPLPSEPRDRLPGRRNDPTTTTERTSRDADDSIKPMLDQLYLTADSYLKELAEKSGGRLLRADTLVSLPAAFQKISAELRTQYSLGYYPTNKARDHQYRKIKVTSARKNVIIRARPGYRAPSGATAP